MALPNKKKRSDKQNATTKSNFAKRHKRKRGGRTKNSLQNRLLRGDGKKKKDSTYDFASASVSLGVAVFNSQAIKSAVMHIDKHPPQKPTIKEYTATIKRQVKQLSKLGGQLKMKVTAVLKLKR